MKKNIDEISKDELVKAIYRECKGCMSYNELKVARCEMITCPFHKYIPYIIDVEEIENDLEQKKQLALDEKKMAKVEKKRSGELSDEAKKLTLKKKEKKGSKV